MTEVQHYHPAYKIVHQYEHLLYPLAAGAVGLTTAGLYGAVGAVILGLIDSTAINFKIYDKPYLTSITLSWAATYSFELPYKINQVIGVIAGILLPTGMLDEHMDKFIAPAQGVLYGSIVFGNIYGPAIGFSIGAIDEGLSYYNISNEYHFTTMLTYYANANTYTSKIIDFSKYLFGQNIAKHIYFINDPSFKMQALTIIHEYLQTDSKGNTSLAHSKLLALELNTHLYQSYSKVIEKEQLDDLRLKSFISTISTKLIAVKLSILIAQKQQNMVEGFHGIGEHGFHNFFSAFKAFILFLPITTTEIAISSFLNFYFSSKFFNLAEKNILETFMSNETALFLSKNSTNNGMESNVLLKNMDDDISKIINQGGSLISDGLGTGIKGIYSSLHLIKLGAADMILYSQHYNQLTSFFTVFLSSRVNSNADSIKELQAKLSSIDEYTRTHASEMTQNDANDFVYELRKKINTELKTLVATKSIYEAINYPWQYFRSYVDFSFNYVVLAYKISSKEIAFGNRFEILFLSADISQMIGWESKNIASFSTIYQSISRFDEFNTRMEMSTLPSENKIHYSYTQSNESKTCFQNIDLARNKLSFLHIEDLCLSGERVSITGASGGGKTSFFKILKGINHEGIDGTGNITFYTKTGLAPKFLMISQKIYIPPYTTLLELITQKNGEEAKKYEKDIFSLEQEIKNFSEESGQTFLKLMPRLNEKEVWEKVLSGGETQWLGIIRILLSKPDIVLADEILKGLDPNSIKLFKHLLDTYLPETQVIIIDHEAKAHNSDGFYDCNLHFANQTAILGETELNQ